MTGRISGTAGGVLGTGQPARLSPAEAAETARAKALGAGLSPERAEKRAREAEEMAWIGVIASRADDYIKANPDDFDPKDWERTNSVIMLIQVKKANPRLDLKKFAEFDNLDFLHDFFGIARHAKPPTGELGGLFLPRAMRGGA